MARIPVPDQINPRAIAGDRLAMQAPDLSAPARALQGLGSALSGLAERYQADKNKMDAYNTNLQLEKFTTDQTIGYQQDLDTSAPDGSDFLAKREKGLTEGYQKIRAGIKDPELGAKADLVFEQLRGNQLVKGTQDVKQKQTSYVLATTNESVSNIIQSGALDSKEQFDDYYENVIKPRIGSVITDPLQRQKMETTFGQQLREEYFRLHPEAIIDRSQPAASGGDALSKSASLLRKFEGFRETTYWDVTAHRTGYGSDTITKADGSVVRVQKGMRVSRADAERDLTRRTKEFQAQAANDVGESWGKFNADQQAALTSVAYNYGSLPKRVINAARTGDPEAVARAVESLSDHNGGVNRKRREEEAAVIRGGASVPSSGSVTPRMPSGGIFEGMDGAEYDRYVTRARTQARTTIADIGKDELSSLEFNGEYTGRSLNADDFAIAYGDEGPDRFASYDAARETAAQKHAYKDMSSDQILADINKRSAETPDGEGAGEYISNLGELQAVAKKILDDRDVERKKYLTEVEGRIAAAGRRQIDIANTRNERFKAIQIEKAAQITAAAELLTLRKNDPAGYVFQTNQGVRQAWREFNPRDPQSADAAIAATIAAQEAIGIGPGDIMPLPKEQAAAIAKMVLDDERPVDERMETMMGIVQQTRNPDHQRAIFKQLEKAGVPPAGEVVIDAYMRNDQGAARRLFTAATAKAENLPGKGQRETGFDDAVSDALFDEDSPGYAIYGLDYADPMSAQIASRDLALVKTAATLSMAGGMAQDAAIAQAIKDVHGPMQMLDASFPNGGNVKGVIPEGTDPDMVAAGMDAVVPSIRTNLLGSKQLGLDNLPADVGPDAINVLTATQDNEVERIIEEGVFRNAGNGWGFFDVYSGTFIAYPNGTPMTWTTEELIGIGTRDLPPADKTAPMGDVPDVNPRLKQMMGIE